MISFNLGRVQKVMCLGAHSDDIEIGCGGTILRLIREQPGIEFYWHVFSANKQRRREAQQSARAFLSGAKIDAIQIANFRESYFPSQWFRIKNVFEELKKRFGPDLIFTHYRDDRHQDHALISDLTWNGFRDHLILEYDIPKYDGDLGQPNFFVQLDEELCRQKTEIIMRYFQSQASKHWFTEDALQSMLRIRGIECAHRCAEAFHCRKVFFGQD